MCILVLNLEDLGNVDISFLHLEHVTSALSYIQTNKFRNKCSESFTTDGNGYDK